MTPTPDQQSIFSLAAAPFLVQILDNTQEAILIVQDNRIVFFNRKLLEFSGYAEPELMQLRASALIHPADQDLLEEAFRYIRMHPNQSYIFTFRLTDKHGETRWMESKLASMNYNDAPAAIFYIYDISEFKQAEEAVNVSLDFLNALIDTIPSPMFYKNTRGEYIGCNSAFVNFMGLPREQILGHTSYDLLQRPHELPPQHQLKLIDQTGFQVHETQMVHADGSLHDVISHHATFYLADKSVGGVVGILTDISERKQIENQLRHTEFRYQQLVRNLTQGIVVLRPMLDGTRFVVSEINLAGERIWQTTATDVVNQSLTDFFGPEHIHDLYPMLRQTWMHSESTHLVHQHRTAQGRTQWVRYYFYKVPSGDLVGLFEDITEAQRIEQVLRQSEAQYRFLVENSTDFILQIDAQQAVLFSNKAFAEAFGLHPEQLHGRSLLQFVHPMDAPALTQALAQAAQNRLAVDTQQRLILPGGIRWYAWTLQAVGLADQQPTWLCIGKNIQQIKDNEQGLLHAKRRAEENDKLKSAFVANMSHEIRTPLNAIIGSSELIANRNLSEAEQREYLHYIVSNGKNLLGLINEIIDASKIDAGQVKISSERIHLHELLNDIHGSFKTQGQQNTDVELRLRIHPDDQRLFFYSDQQRIQQILTNLINNALKFTDHGYIELRYQLHEQSLERYRIDFEVQDTGIGIPPDQIEHIFQRFGQVAEHQKRNRKGTGLGLAISKQLAELLGGQLTVDSALGHGSTFRFSLPAKVEMNVPARVELPTEPKAYHWPGRTILIAEDNKINMMILRKLLEPTQVTLLLATNGAEAVKLFASQSVDLVLMDMQMPIMDGYEATHRIKGHRPSAQVIAQTASAMFDDRQRILDAGCDDFVAKPFDTRVLLEKIDRLLHIHPAEPGS